jgi:hypothetical protein
MKLLFSQRYPAELAVIAAHKAWSNRWIGNSDVLLANLMDELRKPAVDPKKAPYNHSIAIIQSSGMGKSRLMDAVAMIKFCFPLNIREDLPSDQRGGVTLLYPVGNHCANICHSAYPPSDRQVYEFFQEPHLRQSGDETEIELKYIAFFVGLLRVAQAELHHALRSTASHDSSIPQRWRNYLAQGATEYAVGQKRRRFYDEVTKLAMDLLKETKNNGVNVLPLVS